MLAPIDWTNPATLERPNSVINNPDQIWGGNNSLVRNPGQIWGGENSFVRNPSQIWGGPNSVFNNPQLSSHPSLSNSARLETPYMSAMVLNVWCAKASQFRICSRPADLLGSCLCSDLTEVRMGRMLDSCDDVPVLVEPVAVSDRATEFLRHGDLIGGVETSAFDEHPLAAAEIDAFPVYLPEPRRAVAVGEPEEQALNLDTAAVL
ncbi:hypothetical protein AF71_00061190 [Rhizobium sp. 57MFTsu3.2]|nr:hypothetical protein [Rhizobium sp. 57MFTsu3.2]